MVPYYELSPSNQKILTDLQEQDIADLIQSHRFLLQLEWILLLLLGSLLIAILLHFAWRYLQAKFYPKVEQHHLKKQLNHLVMEKDQKTFLDLSDQFIRSILHEKLHQDSQGLTDLELFAFFHGTKLEQQSEQALSLLDQGRYSETPLTPVERNQVTAFLHDLYTYFRS